MHNIPRLYRFILILTLVNLLAFSLLRISLFSYFNVPSDPIALNELLKAFYLGLKFDLRLSLLITLPLFLLAGIYRINPFKHIFARRFWLSLQTSIFSFILFVYFINFAFFSYLNKPLDASSFRFLKNFSISMDMVWATYPIVWLSLLLLFISSLYAYSITKAFNYIAKKKQAARSKKQKLVTVTLAVFLVIFGLYGKLSYYPLRWSDAFFSSHSFTSTVTMNPILYFINTLKNREVNFDTNKVKQYYSEIADYLGVKDKDINTFNFSRHITPTKKLEYQPNIVVVILESFSAYKTGVFGNPLKPTPAIDALANNGVYFSNFYTPSTGTARSVWTAVTGIPDIELNKTSTRNPLIVNQRTLINAFTDYDKLYFIGGSASWGNIRGLLSGNIDNLKLYEEGGYTAPRMDVWGISDLHLFEEANKVLKKQTKPFFSIVQTSGNHRPYNIPEDNHGFITKKITKKEAKKFGFQSSDEYNAFRFMDHSVGFFIEQAKKEKYFDDTIFVFFGDHGVNGSGQHMTEAQQQLHINSLNVPLIIYSPKLLKQQTHTFATSEVDVLPTLASLAGLPYTNYTLGDDLLNPQIDKSRYVYTMIHRTPHTISLVSENFMYSNNNLDTKPILHDLNSKQPRKDVSAKNKNKTEKLKRLTFGLYETMKYMRYNNAPNKTNTNSAIQK